MKKLDRKIADVTGASNRVVNEIISAGGNLISDVSDGQLLETLRVACFPGGVRLRSTGKCYQKIYFTTLMKTMKTLLKRSALLLALPISVLVNFSLRASADSTAGIILSTKCQGGYNINIWQNYNSGELLYRATNPNGHLNLGKGTKQATEGVRVYKFRNRNYEYWVWDGTLDNPQSGTLEVYKNNRILMRQTCRKN